MSKSFDVVVIGGGPGGYIAAIRAAQLGFVVGFGVHGLLQAGVKAGGQRLRPQRVDVQIVVNRVAERISHLLPLGLHAPEGGKDILFAGVLDTPRLERVANAHNVVGRKLAVLHGQDRRRVRAAQRAAQRGLDRKSVV